MKRLFLLFLFLTASNSCVVLNRVKSYQILSKAKVTNSDFHSVLKYESVSNIQIFNVEIEGKTYRFMFDSGGYTVLSEDLIESLDGVKEASFMEVRDGNNTTRIINTYVLDKLQIGNTTFSRVGFAKIDYTESEWFKCLGLDGVLGPNVMNECLWLIDDQAKQITLTNDKKRLPILTNAIEVPIEIHIMHKPIIKFIIGTDENILGFDTGFSGLLGLTGSLYNSSLKQYPTVTKIGARTNSGLTTTYTDTKVIKLDSINIDGLVLKNVIAESRDNAPSNLLGSRIFEYYKVLIDFSDKKMFFEEITSRPLMEESIESFGIGLDFRDGNLVVDFVYEPSSAKAKGIVPGEVIKKINGQKINYSDYCDFVNNFKVPNGDQFELELIRDTGSTIIMLTKEKLL